ncbi:hypothetical protein GH714_027517 [Hevea brasiliensis]|uniref:Autophagy-related protein 9 n=1 Tax=Hevea brasiliensis TaxID=3981 RepID=A0A6A6N462_HEVBR|nr:hypothetical protein GH714_027517 [Hevea brasiliensis]
MLFPPIFELLSLVDHLFKHRINGSIMLASDYLKQFPSPIISIIAKFISFVSGGFAAILIIIAFLEESLLEGHIFGRNLFWYAAVFGTITAIGRAAITDELLVLEPERAMSMVVQHTHFMPKRWRGKENTETVQREFENLFQYTGMMLLEEMASIFLTPFLLLFVVPKRVDDILQFIADFTVNIEGVGHVCSFSAFDFQNHGNSNYGSPYHTPRNPRSSQGKMEKSFLSFQSSYPSWEPNAHGKQFLSNLRNFRKQKLQGHGFGLVHSHPRTWQGSSNLRGPGNRNTPFSREMPHYTSDFDLGSLWLIDEDQKSHPYLLDWYYTSQTSTNYGRDIPAVPFEVTEQHPGDHWLEPNFTQNEAVYDDERWRHHYEDRTESHLGASTSTPFFRESILQQHEVSSFAHSNRSHWWARSSRPSAQPQTSFLEPPDFNRFTSDNFYDNFSERSLEEQEHLNWRSSHRLSRTTYLDDDLEAGENINLHFDDIYSRPPETPTEYREPPSF